MGHSGAERNSGGRPSIWVGMTYTHSMMIAARLAGRAALVGAAVAGASGGSRNVGGARGLGASQYNVHETNRQEWQIDNWLFGEEAKARDNSRSGGVRY